MNKKNQKITEIIEAFAGKKVIVWGDIILDEYIYGTTRRVSREAPVLVLSYKEREYALGGAGNALINLHSLGAKPVPVGLIGKDAAGEKIIQILKANNISTKNLIQINNFSTPTKSRILAGEETAKKQQILRIDYEGKAPEDKSVQERLLKNLMNLKDNSQAMLISDYNYFVVRESIYKQLLPGFRKLKVPISLDSRFRILNFKGVNISTPNESEVEEAFNIEFNSNEDLVNKTGRRLLNETEAEAVLITRGSKGMVLFEKKKPPWSIPVHGTTDIVDVTGAGDTVISVFTLALACGSSNKDAATLANHAGGMVVMKKGTAAITIEELKKSILSEN
jgi:rfaE bifunctional protein kinase chain/domain